MHLKRGIVNIVARTGIPVKELVIAQHMTDVLTEIAFDALAEFLHAINVRLRHTPRSIRHFGLARSEGSDALFDLEVPRDIGDEIFNERKGLHRLNGDRPLERRGA